MAGQLAGQPADMAAAPRPHGLGVRFWSLCTAVTVSSWGDGLEVAALPLLAASLSGDPRLVSGVTAAATLPWLVFGLVAGGVVDRLDRRRLMWRVNLARAGLVGLLAALVAVHHMDLPLLYALVFLLGIGQTLFDTASQAILPDLVAADRLDTANGRRQVGEIAGETLTGPPAGSALYAVAAFIPFGLDALTFLAAGGLVHGIKGDFTPRPAAGQGPPRSLRADIAEGLRWLVRHPVLRPLAAVLGLANLAIYMGQGVLVLFALHEIHLGQAGYGLLLTAMAVGGVLGGAVSGKLAAALGPVRCIAVALAGLLASQVLIGVAPGAVLAGAAGAFGTLAGTLWNVVTISLRQRLIPRRLLGRVNSAYRMIGMGSMPIGALLGGAIASTWGLRAPYLVAGALLAAALLLAAARITPAKITRSLAANQEAP
jgi:MFS family permease